MFLVVRKVLIGHVTVLEIDRVRPLGLDEPRLNNALDFFRLTLKGDDHALPVGNVIEV